MFTIKTRFKRFRKAKRMTQRQLGLALGISRREVIYVEKGEKGVSVKTELAFMELVERHKNPPATVTEGSFSSGN